MALPAALLEPLTDLGREAGSQMGPAPRGSWREAVNRHLAKVERLENSGRLVQERLAALLAEVASGLEKHGSAVALDRLTEELHTWECRLKEGLWPEVQAAKAIPKKAFSLPEATAQERARAISTADRHVKAVAGTLAALRDARLELVILRSESEDPGDAPVFDDPAALQEYLKSPLE
jgi:hypothetical protein